MESEEKHLFAKRNKSWKNRRLEICDSSDSDSSDSLSEIDVDALKYDTPSINNAIDPLSLQFVEEKSVTNAESDDKIVPNDASKTTESNSDCRFELMPLENFVSQIENTKLPVKLSIEPSSDDALVTQIKVKSNSSKTPNTTRKSFNNIHDTDEFDSSVPIDVPQRKTKAISTHIDQKIYAVTVRLTRMPSNMEPLLEKYNLIEICDQDQNVIVSRETNHRNEVQNLYIVYGFSHFSVKLK